MIPEHVAIIVPGLSNDVSKLSWAVKGWEQYGITTIIFDAKWKVEEPKLSPKIKRAVKIVDDLRSQGKRISLIGNSAGASFVLNVFSERKSKVNKVVINCGRIRTGDLPWFTFKQATAGSPSFRESVLMAQSVQANFTQEDLAKILTLRPVFDEIVPVDTVALKGAKNIVSPSAEHMATIALNLTLFRVKIFNFILSE